MNGEIPYAPVPLWVQDGRMNGADKRAPGHVVIGREHVQSTVEQIPVREAVRAIQKSLQDYENRIIAAIEGGRSYYAGNKLHYARCSSLQRDLWPTRSWLWATEADDPEEIEIRYAELIHGYYGSGFMLSGRLVTREQAAETTLKRCRICAPDINTRKPRMPAKQVANLTRHDVGRLLNGDPIQSITHELGAVIVQTCTGAHQFDPHADIYLDPAPASPRNDEGPAK